MEAAQQLVRSIRLLGGSQSESIATPPGALLLDGPRVLRDLLRYAIGQGASGIVLHLNNLENLSEADASRAADLLRGIRDQALLHDGLHLIVALNHRCSAHGGSEPHPDPLGVQRPFGAGAPGYRGCGAVAG